MLFPVGPSPSKPPPPLPVTSSLPLPTTSMALLPLIVGDFDGVLQLSALMPSRVSPELSVPLRRSVGAQLLLLLVLPSCLPPRPLFALSWATLVSAVVLRFQGRFFAPVWQPPWPRRLLDGWPSAGLHTLQATKGGSPTIGSVGELGLATNPEWRPAWPAQRVIGLPLTDLQMLQAVKRGSPTLGRRVGVLSCMPRQVPGWPWHLADRPGPGLHRLHATKRGSPGAGCLRALPLAHLLPKWLPLWPARFGVCPAAGTHVRQGPGFHPTGHGRGPKTGHWVSPLETV